MDEDPKSRRAETLRRALPALTLLGVVSVLAGLLVAPGFAAQTLPQLRTEDVGRPFESASAVGFKATRDYDLPDAALTDRRRQEARAGVRPVFDFNPSVVPEVQGTVQESFALLRGAFARMEPPAKPSPGKRRSEPVDGSALAQARRAFEERLFEVEDEDWKALADARAPPEVEHAVLAVLSRGFLAPVVGAREDLGPAGSSLALRDLNDGAEHPSAVVPPAVLDVREARAEMDRWATLPGNLLPDSPPLLRRAVLRIAKRALRPNLTANIAETERRRGIAAASVKDAVIQIKKGQKIIGDGELVTQEHLRLLAAMRAQSDRFDVVEASAGTAALVALLLAGIWTFHRKAFRRFRPTRRDGLLLGGLLILFLGAFRLAAAVAEAMHDRWPAVPVQALMVLLPVAAGAMLVRLLLNQELALFFGLVLSTLVGVMLGNSLFFAVYGLLGSLVAATQVARARDRAALFRSGLWVGLVNAAVVLAFALAAGKGPPAGRGPVRRVRRRRLDADRPHPGPGAHPVAGAELRLRERPQAARAGQPQPPGAQGAHRPEPRHVPPQHHRREPGRGGGGGHRLQPAARADLRLLPRHREGEEPALLRREPEGRRTRTTASPRE